MRLLNHSIQLGSLATLLLLSSSCQQSTQKVDSASTHDGQAIQVVNRPDGWDQYWYAGLAEVNSYDVSQERYGEMRESSEVFIFVTEKFSTGIYDYALMLSVFTPVSYDQHPHTLKSTFSSQDWCGQVWQQANWRGGKFQIEHRSYFQGEADSRKALAAHYLEDELINRVRIDPASVPTGKHKLIPAAKFTRLRHIDAEAEQATIRFGESQQNGGDLELAIDYPQLQRSVSYRFEAQFPHKLLSWTEQYQGKTLSTGTLKESVQEPYWSQNSSQFDGKRQQLGL